MKRRHFDLERDCTDAFKFILFADDSTVLYLFPRQCSATIPEYINGKLNILYDWILATIFFLLSY